DSRDRIIAAMLDLAREGEVAPGAERVAARAEVGLRTVFRHFRDMDSLYAEMTRTIEGELADLIARPMVANDEHGRLVEIARRRAEVFERIFPFKHASGAHRHRSAFLETGHARMTASLRGVLLTELRAACSDPVRREALDLLLSFEAWSRLRREQNLSREAALGVVLAAAAPFLATPGL
ncbi:MAG: TetR/AcrR family transcriptional regulator, partial [Phenylobacterium sp.]